MNRELLLLRHGKSDWNIESDDFNRPLKKRGEKAALRMGEWLLQQNLTPDWIISSPAIRALKTTEKVCRAFGSTSGKINFDGRIYQADLDQLKNVLADCPLNARRVLLVGHNPELEVLLKYLVKEIEIPEDGKLMVTATLARLRMPDDWNDLGLHCAELLSLKRAREL